MATTSKGGSWGFHVRYGARAGAMTHVYVHVGTEERPDEDHQLVFINDERAHFEIRANVWEGRLTDIEFNASSGSGRSIEQQDLRTSGVVKLIRTWAHLGREHQLLQRQLETDRLGGGLEITVPAAGPGLDDAIEETRLRLGALLPSPETKTRKRLRGRDADDLLTRVARRYQQLVEEGHRQPRLVIAEEESYSPEHIGRLLVKARRPPYSLLGPATPGRAGEGTPPENTESKEGKP